MSDNKHILHGLGVEYTYTSEGLVSDAASRERDLLAHIAGLEAEKQALITTSVVVNEELSEAKQAIEWLTEQHEDAYKKVGYQAQRAEQAEAILLGEDVTVAAYRNMQAALAQREAERDKVVSVLARALAAKLDQQNRAEQAEAEVAELKVCIVCDHCSGVDDSRWCDEEKPWDESVWLYDLCHYSPSRWTARAERGAK
jgi:hypothetical protein